MTADDIKTILLILNFLLLGPLGWYIRGVVDKLEALQKSHNDHRLHVSDAYLKKSEHDQDIKEIKEMFQKIFDKLDGKADKQI